MNKERIMTKENKDVVTYVDGVKYTQCAYRGPKEFTPAVVKKQLVTRMTKEKEVK